MTNLEIPRMAIGLGLNVAVMPLRANRWTAGIAIQRATETYRHFTVAGEEQAESILLQMPAHNAAVGAETLAKVPKVDKLLAVRTRNVQEMLEDNVDPVVVAAAIESRNKLRNDKKILKATAYCLIGKSLRQVIRNDVPPEVDATAYPPDVQTVVLDTAVETKVEPSRLALPEMDQEIIAIRMARHQVS